MRLIRVFPRITKATPRDDLARFGPPTLFDEADEVHVSVTFSEDKMACVPAPLGATGNHTF